MEVQILKMDGLCLARITGCGQSLKLIFFTNQAWKESLRAFFHASFVDKSIAKSKTFFQFLDTSSILIIKLTAHPSLILESDKDGWSSPSMN